jgi:hypothetical protein
MTAIPQVPHLRVVVAFCTAAIFGYTALSFWAVFDSGDAALKGDAVGTWKSFAVLAFGFWLGSSSGSKIRPALPPGGDISPEASPASQS